MVRWEIDDDNEPFLFVSEVGDDGFEVRRVHVYKDGSSERADSAHWTERIYLAADPVPSVEDISAEEDLEAEQITAAAFEQLWRDAE
jgi:hypothetical protein